MTTANLDQIDPQKFFTPQLLKQATFQELSVARNKLWQAHQLVSKRHSLIWKTARTLYEVSYPDKDFAHLAEDIKEAWYSEAAHILEENEKADNEEI